MTDEKTFVVRRNETVALACPDNMFPDVTDDGGKVGVAMVIPYPTNATELEVTIKSRKSKRERKLEVLKSFALTSDEVRAQILDALEVICREDG